MEGEGPSLIETEDGLQVRYGKRNLYSPSGARSSAEKKAERAVLKPASLILVPSPILWYGVDRLLSRIDDRSIIVCIEADENLHALSSKMMPEALRSADRLHFLPFNTGIPANKSAGIHLDRLVRYLQKEKALPGLRSVQLLSFSAGYRFHAELYRLVEAKIAETIRNNWRNRMTIIRMGRLWIRNCIDNLFLKEADNALEDLSADKPILIAGAGESLEESLDLIRRHRERLYILAVDTALPVLSKRGICPDLVVCLEAQVLNLYDFIPVSGFDTNIASDIVSYPSIPRRFPEENRFYFSSQFAANSLLKRLSEEGLLPCKVPPLGSVGVSAFYLASRLTDMPIFLSGLDFAYKLGKPHARGAPTHLSYLYSHNRLSPPSLYASCLIRPRQKKLKAYAEYFTSDQVLYSYAEQLTALIKQRAAVYVLFPKGLDTGAISLRSDEEFAAAIENIPNGAKSLLIHREGGKSRDGEEQEPWGNVGRDAAHELKNNTNQPRRRAPRMRDFLVSEAERIEDALESIHGFIADESPEKGKRLLEELEQLDYLYLDFPDSGPLPNLRRDFLKRCIGSGRYYLGRIRRKLGIEGN